jgi:hypothetical protein
VARRVDDYRAAPAHRQYRTEWEVSEFRIIYAHQWTQRLRPETSITLHRAHCGSGPVSSPNVTEQAGVFAATRRRLFPAT